MGVLSSNVKTSIRRVRREDFLIGHKINNLFIEEVTLGGVDDKDYLNLVRNVLKYMTVRVLIRGSSKDPSEGSSPTQGDKIKETHTTVPQLSL